VKRIVVTGATGFIGRHAVAAFEARGFEIHALSRRGAPAVPEAGAMHHAVDLLDQAATAQVIAAIKPTHLLHLAWDVEPGKYWTSLDNLSWVAASLTLFRAFHDAGGRRAVFAGTCAEYDWAYETLSETATPLAPRTLYGHAKNSLRALIDAAAISGVSTAWGRIFFLYGRGEPRRRLVSDVFHALLSGQTIETTRGTQQRDFMNAADVGAAFAALADSAVTGAVNIASGRCVAVRDVLALIGEMTGRPDLLAIGARAAAPDDPPRLAADVMRLTREVAFTPRYSLEDGLADTHDWWKSQISGSPSV
jgi:nucleoside-diphosphate-sugar epimerase